MHLERAHAAHHEVAGRENTKFARISNRIHALELARLGGADIGGGRHAHWIVTVHEVEEFAARHRRLPRRGRHLTAGERALGEWIHHQQQRRYSMSGYAAARLGTIPGWQWHPRRSNWDARFEQLDRFVRTELRPPSPKAAVESERRLGRWVQRQRDGARLDELSADKRDRLKLLGFPMPRPRFVK